MVSMPFVGEADSAPLALPVSSQPEERPQLWAAQEAARWHWCVSWYEKNTGLSPTR